MNRPTPPWKGLRGTLWAWWGTGNCTPGLIPRRTKSSAQWRRAAAQRPQRRSRSARGSDAVTHSPGSHVRPKSCADFRPARFSYRVSRHNSSPGRGESSGQPPDAEGASVAEPRETLRSQDSRPHGKRLNGAALAAPGQGRCDPCSTSLARPRARTGALRPCVVFRAPLFRPKPALPFTACARGTDHDLARRGRGRSLRAGPANHLRASQGNMPSSSPKSNASSHGSTRCRSENQAKKSSP